MSHFRTMSNEELTRYAINTVAPDHELVEELVIRLHACMYPKERMGMETVRNPSKQLELF